MSYRAIVAHLRRLADPARAEHALRYFKTGPGEYGEGDRFLGIRVPQLREAVKEFRGAGLDVVRRLLASQWHEVRLFALLLLVDRFRRGDEAVRREVYELYLASTDRINNWDLVDCSTHHIVGGWLADRSKAPLGRLAKSTDLWERRIAMVATYHFIKQGDHGPTLELAERLLADGEDLMHKAVGWMLREVGKRDVEVLRGFLHAHYQRMPRTALRYAIERLPERERKGWLKKPV